MPLFNMPLKNAQKQVFKEEPIKLLKEEEKPKLTQNLKVYPNNFVYCYAMNQRYGYVSYRKDNTRLSNRSMKSLSDDLLGLNICALREGLKSLQRLGIKEANIYSEIPLNYIKEQTLSNDTSSAIRYNCIEINELLGFFDNLEFIKECPYEEIKERGRREATFGD